MRVLVLVVLAWTSLVMSCGQPLEACVTGDEGCKCWANATCNDALACRSGLCVKLEASDERSVAGTRGRGRPPSSADAGADPDASAASTTDAAAGTGGAVPRAGTGSATAGVGGAQAPAAAGVSALATPTAGSSGAAAGCAKAGGACTINDDCCNAALCVQNVCAANCKANSDCLTACCFTLTSGESVCAPANICPPDAGPAVPAPPKGTGGPIASFPSTCVSSPQPTAAVIESTIFAEFEGWTGETLFKLDNGQYWKQTSFAFVYHYAYRPHVLIVSENGVYRLHVDGVSDAISVELLTVVADSRITSDFSRWDGDTIVELASGQIWQQTSPSTAVGVTVDRQAVVYCDFGHFEMAVDGLDGSAQVRRVQ